MWIVYLIQHTITKQIYLGVTKNLKERLENHNAGGKKFTTRKDGRWIIVYAEIYRSKEDAVSREKKLKSHGSGKHELLKRLSKSLLEPKTGAGRSESFSGDCLPKTQLPAKSQDDV